MQDFASQNSLHDVDLSFDALYLFFFSIATQQRFVPRSGGGAASGKTNMEKAVKSLQIICRSSLVGDFPPAVCWQAHAEIHLDGWCVCIDRGRYVLTSLPKDVINEIIGARRECRLLSMGPAAYNREKTSNIGHPRAFRQFRAKKKWSASARTMTL